MKKNSLKIIQYIIFLAIGIGIFWWIYRDLKWEELKTSLQDVNWFWLVMSVVFIVISHASRALRWAMLIKPLGHNVRFKNMYSSIFILYMTNLIIPRAGEIARCTVVSKYEEVPLTKLIGTVFTERLIDVLALLLIAVAVLLMNVETFQLFLSSHEEINRNIDKLFTAKNLLIGLGFLIVVMLVFVFFRPSKANKFLKKINIIITNLKEGIKSITQMQNKWLFVGHTIFIYAMYLLSFYAVFLAFPFMADLTFNSCLFVFLMGGLAMLAPVQGGIGPWHFMVIESLILFGISETDGKVFALVAHTSTNLINLLFGAIIVILMPILNRSK